MINQIEITSRKLAVLGDGYKMVHRTLVCRVTDPIQQKN
ncbi:hypothetical protein VCR15J5_560046 [Vibrio crassostreae]|nr:hypothetical protein VCR15J5_560046 [Vibrio crassostreae]